MNVLYHETALPPELSALEASLSALEPTADRRESTKSAALQRLCETGPPLSGEKLIETIVKSGDREITLSLREYVKSATFAAGFQGAVFGIVVGILIGLALGGVLTLMITKQPVREVHHVPYFVGDPLAASPATR